MNLKHVLVMAVLLVATVTWSVADSDTVRTKKAAPLKKVSGEEPVDRDLEIRVGPRVSEPAGAFSLAPTLLGANIGAKASQTVTMRDLGLDEVDVGAQLDVDWQPWKKVHALVGYKYDQTSQTKTLQKDLSFAGCFFPNGTSFKTDAELHQIDFSLGYDVYKDETFKVMPFFGGKAAVWSIEGTGTQMKVINLHPAVAGTAAQYGTASFYSKDNGYYVTYLGGFDFKVNITRDYYIGITPAFSGLSNWYMVQGQFYTGYDFNKSWGVRAGFDTTYVNYSHSNQKAEAGIGAVYVQAIYGF
jgi:hypothetical protein